MSAPYRQDIERCFAETIGEGGLSAAGYGRYLEAAGRALAHLGAARAAGGLAFVRAAERGDDLAAIGDLAAALREGFDDVLVLGTGGSSLGGRTVAALAERGFGPPAGAPRLHFLENVDPDTFAAARAALAPARTGVVAISKSGATAETLCQILITLAWLRASVGEAALARHVAVVTEAGDSPLAGLAARFGLPRLEHDPELGGRFSAFSVVGALPALLIGLDATALRAGGCAAFEAAVKAPEPAAAAPAAGAAIAVGLASERMVGQSVLMPYCDRLAPLARWYRQLWAESLGKEGAGTTPVAALGTVDQHSQLQLYLAGPQDKMFTLIRVAADDGGPAVEPGLAEGGALAYLAGRSMGELLAAEAEATAATLARHGRPLRVLALERLDEAGLGALLMHFMLETVIAAELFGVDPYDQPAVEEGKRLARAYLAGEAAP